MSRCNGFDHHQSYHSSQPRGFLTPPPTWKRNRCSRVMPASEKKPRNSPQANTDLFHVVHKVPSGNSPYVRAKHVQLIDKDPSRAISLFWAAINSGDRVDSALKDMAVVMKQLDRSDEAIEAIKSFRHLCPPESQESLDNILVELYKQSGRIEEEIEILQVKLKQLEKGIAFGGRRTKMARSQGKKIQITVEKEYSRLLGNIAWACMQQKDFKSAEEHYRKALSFESDKNKQCNLAVCLMHMNKFSEAKFLLQAIKLSSDNGYMDESYAKSFERASITMIELESQHALKKTGPVGVRDTGYCSRKCSGDNNSGLQLSLVPLSHEKITREAFTEIPYEKRTDFDRRRNYYRAQEEQFSARNRPFQSPFCNDGNPKVPSTQPRRCSLASCRKLFFEQSAVRENPQSSDGDWRKNPLANVEKSNSPPERNEAAKNPANGISTNSQNKKSWADIVEEDEQSWRSDLTRRKYSNNQSHDYRTPDKSFVGSTNKEGFNDENVDANIISETEQLCQKIESIDLESGYFTQPDKYSSAVSQSSVRRSLRFDRHEKFSHTGHSCCPSPLPMKALNFGGQELQDVSEGFRSVKRRNRLQVFHDITHDVGSPKP